jgi:membrane protease YdiL (CAAX protease family)
MKLNMTENLLPKATLPPEMSAETPLAPVAPPSAIRPPRLRDALLICLAYVGFIVLAQLVCQTFGWDDPEAKLGLLPLLLIVWPLTLWFALRRSRETLSDVFSRKPFPVGIIPGLIFMSLGLFMASGFVSNLVPMPEEIAKALRNFDPNPWSMFLTAVVVAPVAEEILCRGWMLRGFRVHYSERKAIIASAAIFALLHMNPWQAIVAFPTGIFFAWLALRTGSIMPGMIGHAAGNGYVMLVVPAICTALGLTASDLEALQSAPVTAGDFLGAIVWSGALMAAGFWWMRRYIPSRVSLEPSAPA